MEIASLAWDVIKTLLSPFLKVMKWLYSKLPFQIVGRKKTLKLGVIENSWRDHTWDYAKRGDEEILIISTHWHITNTLNYHLTTLNAFLVKPEKTKGSIMLKDVNSQYWGHYPIPKGYTTDMEINFAVSRKHIKNADDIVKAKIELQDPLGKFHKIEEVIIKPVKKILKKEDLLKVEDPSKLKDQLEKQVVAVLKNEVQQYKVRGREGGNLGTVEWPRGTMDWTTVGDKTKFLYENSLKEHVTSEHVTALLKLFQKAGSAEKKKIIDAVLKRIDKKSEYRDIGYLIIFFLFEVDNIEDGLKFALKKLQGDKKNAFGDVMRIIDILLTFRYEEFNESELDTIEKFTYSTKEHPFSIRERINAIRVKKMLNNSR